MQSNIRTLADPFFGAKKLGPFMVRVLDIAIVVGAIAVFFFLIWGGIEYITAGGDKVKTENAQKRITEAVLGLAILVVAWAIFKVVLQFFGISDAFFGPLLF